MGISDIVRNNGRRAPLSLTLLGCLMVISFLLPAGARADIRASMVKITTVYNEPSYINPWNFDGSQTKSGSGCVIEGNRILTNAHVISDQAYIDVQRYGDPNKYKASVAAVSHEADLAILHVDNPAFFEGIRPLVLGDLPETQQEVTVFGYPEGGDTLSITKGVVSRIEHQLYAHSFMNILAIQIDAAVNPGNSGGPALINGKIVGVVMQILSNASNIAYVVPTQIIRHFLKDMEDGHFDGIPEDGISVQSMENEELKDYYKMKKGLTGCLVTRVVPGSPAEGMVQPGDVILAVDGHPVADNMTVEFRKNERTSADYYVQSHQIGETVVMDILRNGQTMTCRIPLVKPEASLSLVPRLQYDQPPTYFIYGGLLFMPLTINYLMTWGDKWTVNAPHDLLAMVDELPTRKGEEVVLLNRVMPHDVNRGYHDYSECIIDTVNGQKVNNLRHLIRILQENGNSPYVKFETRDKQVIVLNPAQAARAMPEILETYNIPRDRSRDLE